jgi:tetratricopeptide (TPR) repeat protein
VAHFDQALKADPDQVEALVARGRSRLELNDTKGAREDFVKASQLSPDGPTAAVLGYHLSGLREHARAIDCYDRALRERFVTAEVYADLAYSYFQWKPLELGKARDYLDEALKLNPDLQAAYHTRALLDLRRACLEPKYLPRAGLEDIGKALQKGPETADLHYDAARLYARAAEHKDQAESADTWPRKALEHLQAAVRLGQNPGLLKADTLLLSLNDLPDFQELCRQPAPGIERVRSVRLLEPLVGVAGN